MLINCPECELQVSDKANSCPHCGYPLKPSVQARKSNKPHMRLPNGFGQISYIKNRNLRNPWRAMVTIGKTDEGRPICKILKPDGYFPSYNEAYKALVEYNKNPYDLEADITVEELYERWSEEYFETLSSRSSVRTITSAWKYCSNINKMRVKDVRARHIKALMDQDEVPLGTKQRIKSLFNMMLDYAVEYEIVDKNYARTFKTSSTIIDEAESAKNSHIAFSDLEMETLWANINRIQYVDAILFQCYMGWRPQELGLLKLENINLTDWTITGGMKTEAGTNRVVPIHPKIRKIVRELYNQALSMHSEYLINCIDAKTHLGSTFMTYDKYNVRFCKIRDDLGLNSEHRPHDGRKTFVTMCKKYKVDDFAIKRMIGHAIGDLTEEVYTERDTAWLMEEICKIPE